ncbi:hypothetical protein OSTOST_23799 [Ostertagia ostertagi]
MEPTFESDDVASERPFPSTRLTPFLKRIEYDPRTPPVLFVGDKIGIRGFVMAGNESRLRQRIQSSQLLVNEFRFLKKIWRPDPIFTNAKSATFQKVTYLNFYMYIFPGGEVFLDFRVYLKPTAAEIVLCKYSHDNPACSLKITSLGFTSDAVEFEWFSEPSDAIQLNRDLEIPELSLVDVKAETCDGSRKSANLLGMMANSSYMRRAWIPACYRRYIPTTICVVFHGSVFGFLKSLLKRREATRLKKNCPRSLYIKAIDIWFGFTSVFVFLTMLQGLAVITLEHHSKTIRRKCEENLEDYNKYKIMLLMLRSRYYHRTARKVDEFCKVMYPVTFLLFLMIYVFVIIQGDEDKCLQK